MNRDQTISHPKIKLPSESLWIGIGNDGRGDDGLGWAFLDRLSQVNLFQNLVYRFQLQIEDAELVSHAKHVVFVDAFKQPLRDGFQWLPCQPESKTEFTSHRLRPQKVLDLCRQLYDKHPPAHLLLIEGSTWEMKIGLSSQAKANLTRAMQHFIASHVD